MAGPRVISCARMKKSPSLEGYPVHFIPTMPFTHRLPAVLALSSTLLLASAPAHALDMRAWPVIGTLLNMMSPKPQTQQVIVQQPKVTGPTTQVWTIPQPRAGVAYTNTQLQPVYNIYTPTTPVQSATIPTTMANQPLTYATVERYTTKPLQISSPAWQPTNSTTYANTVPEAPSNSAGVGGASSNFEINSGSTSTIANSGRALDNTTDGKLRWPVGTNSSGTKNYVSDAYGDRDRDFFDTGCQDGTKDKSKCGIVMHKGIDIATPYGTNLESMNTGTVVGVSSYCKDKNAKLPGGYHGKGVPGAGCSVSVMSDSGEIITYSHLSDSGDLKVGDSIKAGDSVGKSGNSGGSFGAHLDLSICQVPQEKADAIKESKKNVSYNCANNGGTQVDPITRLDDKDPRTAGAKEKQKITQEHVACKRAAGKDAEKRAKCDATYKSKKAKWQAANKKGRTDSSSMNSHTGDLTMKRF
jgi:murein DD-endopeptidase MepM/ murein hydrolase activator NlpD